MVLLNTSAGWHQSRESNFTLYSESALTAMHFCLGKRFNIKKLNNDSNNVPVKTPEVRDYILRIFLSYYILSHSPVRLTSCSILYSLSLLASFSSASLQTFCTDSSSCRTWVFKRAVRASFSLPERLLSSSRCCRDFTVAPATAYRSGHSA